MPVYEDGNFHEVAREAEEHMLLGNLVFQKWTCRFCGERITMGTPNVFFTRGQHEDCKVNPHEETDIEEQGCNYLLIQGGTRKGEETIKKWLQGHD